MFNTDMAVFYNMEPANDNTGQHPDCSEDSDTCAESPTATIANNFANDNTLFLQTFARCFSMMLDKGYTNLVEVPLN